MVHLSKPTSTGTLPFTELHASFGFHWFLPCVLVAVPRSYYYFESSVSDSLLQSLRVPQVSLGFGDLGSFKECWLGIS